MRSGTLLAVFVGIAMLAACSTSDVGSTTAGTSFVYQHTRVFLIDEVRTQLSREWPAPAIEAETQAVITDWKEQLAVMSRFGRRDRLRVVLEGADGKGWKVVCTQETQRNMEQEDPLSSSKAEWEAQETDAALAQKFLFDLHRRLNPKQAWREATIR
ncbi:MAG: hypothetical protein EXS14_04720 [Planctomycetes bacterium]|nr:hypothetical protein [Planctomycetota bacterium]